MPDNKVVKCPKCGAEVKGCAPNTVEYWCGKCNNWTKIKKES